MDQLALDILKTALYNAPVTEGTVTLEILEQFRSHTIHSLVADAVLKYDMAPGVREKVEQYLALQMTNFASYMKEQSRLTELLHKEGLTPVILKGASAAMYYPEPGLRQMGDIDFFISPHSKKNFEHAVKLLEEAGYKRHEDQSERHLGLQKGRIEVEVHRFYSHRRNKEELQLDKEIYSSTPVERTIEAMGTYRFYTCPVEHNGIIFLHHISSHLYSGLGFRQIIDWLMYVDAVVTDEFWEHKLRPLAAATGVEKLAIAVTKMGELYLGAPEHGWCKDADTEVCSQLFEMIKTAGNFGRNQNRKDNATMAVFNDRITFKKLQQRGLVHWKAAQKHKILRPFAWIYQICRYIKKGLKRDKNSAGLVENYKEHRKQKQLFAALGIPHEEENIRNH